MTGSHFLRSYLPRHCPWCWRPSSIPCAPIAARPGPRLRRSSSSTDPDSPSSSTLSLFRKYSFQQPLHCFLSTVGVKNDVLDVKFIFHVWLSAAGMHHYGTIIVFQPVACDFLVYSFPLSPSINLTVVDELPTRN